MNFISHISHEQADHFLNALHRRLGLSAIVFMGTDQVGRNFLRRIYTKPGSSDLYTRRERPDGRSYEIINNLFTELSIYQTLEPVATDIRITMGRQWWWASYTIR